MKFVIPALGSENYHTNRSLLLGSTLNNRVSVAPEVDCIRPRKEPNECPPGDRYAIELPNDVRRPFYRILEYQNVERTAIVEPHQSELSNRWDGHLIVPVFEPLKDFGSRRVRQRFSLIQNCSVKIEQRLV